MTLDERLSDLELDLGGFGQARSDAIRETFDSEQDFEQAARQAYDDRDTDALEAIPGVGRGYALKLARWYARREGWSGGDAEPQPIPVLSGDEFVDELQTLRDP